MQLSEILGNIDSYKHKIWLHSHNLCLLFRNGHSMRAQPSVSECVTSFVRLPKSRLKLS